MYHESSKELEGAEIYTNDLIMMETSDFQTQVCTIMSTNIMSDFKVTTHLQLVLRSRKCGSIHPLPHMPYLTLQKFCAENFCFLTNHECAWRTDLLHIQVY
jgi:hypothetical protein